MTPATHLPTMRAVLYIAFAASGVAGLLYEMVWSRYLALFVGHAAYAQVLVISVFLGGLAIGSLAIGRRSPLPRAPLLWYAAAEAALCAAGLLFHPWFTAATEVAYAQIFPALGSPALTRAVQWTLAALLILPQAILLGVTFPLMSAGLLRANPARGGFTVAMLYFVNSLGGALGVLLGGFVLIAWTGLPGVLLGAAALNGLAAVLAVSVYRASRGVGAGAPAVPPQAFAGSFTVPSTDVPGLCRLLIGVSFFTALASFIYEIGWIRMLSLAMGAATHSFELMLSAFILGLALGSLLVARLANHSARPLWALGWIQWLMGLTALLTLLAYRESFDLVGAMVQALPQETNGYRWFAVGRYGVALMVMLPSTICAGMTLPLITATLLRAGVGERAVGWVYGVNTLGSVTGVALAGLALLPLLGLKGMLVAGASLDMGLGVLVLFFASRRGWAVRPQSALVAATLGVVAVLSVGGLVPLDGRELISGVYRYGELLNPESFEGLYYADGRTATVGVHRLVDAELTVLSTNGKPDASLSDRWLRSTRETLDREPIYWQDESTQVVAAITALAHTPALRDAAMIGHGSGVTAHYLLASPDLERLVTIEIEPRMVEASQVFLPANARVFEDPRSTIIIDDAKAYFSHRQERYDLILSEPSNPWVSGTSSLFTREFYQRVGNYLTPHGVFAQWIQLYELTDAAAGTVLAALHEGFRDYAAFLVGDSDLLIIATNAQSLPAPDWSVVAFPDLRHELRHVHPLVPSHLEATRVFDRASVAPLLEQLRPANSDYFPHLDLAAEKGRFLNSFASGLFGLASDRFDLAAALGSRRTGFGGYSPVPVWGIPKMRALGLGGWLRNEDLRSRPASQAPAFEYREAAQRYGELLGLVERNEPPPRGWIQWTRAFHNVEATLHGATAGVVDEAFFAQIRQYLEGQGAPAEVWASVAFLHGLAGWDAQEASDAAAQLVEPVAEREAMWIPTGTLLDGTVWARIALGDPAGAQRALDRLLPTSGRGAEDFRVRLLQAHIHALVDSQGHVRRGRSGPRR